MDDASAKAIPDLEKDKEADPLQKNIDPLHLSTSRGHTPGPRRGAGRGRTPGHRAPPASQPMPPLTLEVVGGGSERLRRACTQEEPTKKKK